ncbi:MAG TPA: hypothetical protein VFR70_08590 [Flavobacterium sp.]|nr:hypothetical protein [Flavobacterium sp.]
MSHKNQFQKSSSWKYLLLLYAVVAFIAFFPAKAAAQEKQHGAEITIDKNTSDAAIKSSAESFQKEHGVSFKVFDVKRNTRNEIIALKVSMGYLDKDQPIEISSNEPIEPIRFYKDKEGIIFDSKNTTIIKR